MKTAMKQMLDELMAHEYTIPIELIVKCKDLIGVEKEQMITAMMYHFNESNTLLYGMEYLSKRDEMIENCFKYYNKTYNNGL